MSVEHIEGSIMSAEPSREAVCSGSSGVLLDHSVLLLNRRTCGTQQELRSVAAEDKSSQEG